MFHSCRVKTSEEAIIANNMEYQSLVRKIASADGNTSLHLAHQQLIGEQGIQGMDRRQSMDSFRLPIKRIFVGLYTIEVMVNEYTLRFIIDTGAQVSGIKEEVAKQLKLKQASGSIQISSIGGSQKTMKGWIANRLQIGALELFQYPLITLDKLKVPFLKMDGIIGWDILSTLDFEIDDISKELIVLKNRYRFDYCNMIQSTFPIVVVLDEQKEMRLFGIDSGATYSWLNEQTALIHKRKIVNEVSALGIGVHGLEKMNLKVFDGCEISLFKAKIKIHNINTGRTDVLPGLQLDGILGNEIFHNRRIRFINSKGMVLLA